MTLYKFFRFIFNILIRIFWPVKVKGENIYDYNPPFILAANHVSYMDPVILAITVPRPISFIAKKEVFEIPILSCIFKRIGVIPVDRKSINQTAVRKSLNILNEGNILGIFPEGTRSSSGELLDLNIGMIKIALQTNVPIIPVGLYGTHEIYPPQTKFPALFKKQTICTYFGKPIFLDTDKKKDIGYSGDALLKIKNEITKLTELAKKECARERVNTQSV